MSTRFSRRRLLHNGLVISASVALLPAVTRNVLGANEKLNIAGIGAGGKGAVDVPCCAAENIVALADPDSNNAGAMFKRFEKAEKFADYRVMLDKLGKSIDAVTVSTPDHHHAPASLLAMRMGKHVYCQKPMSHSVAEARLMTKVAREMKVVTQMGNQGHNHSGTRRLVELIQAGVLGQVREVHTWTDRAGDVWPQGDRAMAALKGGAGKPCPPHVNFDLWLGPRKEREYNPAYLPFRWRGFWDFGTGAMGDMGCHNMDLAFWSLNLRDPVSAEAEASDHFEEAAPLWAIITTHFPKRGNFDACKLTWYEAGKKPDPALAKEKTLPRNGSIFVGEKDTLYVPHYWGDGKFVSGAKTADFASIPVTLPRMTGSESEGNIDQNHHTEWLHAIKANDPSKALSNFDYAGPMTEAALIGNLAIRAKSKIEWDAKAMKVTNNAEANRYVHGEYRKGWEIGALV